MDSHSLSDLLRSDCDAYNDAISRLWHSDNRMRNDPAYATKRAETLYVLHAKDIGSTDGEIRPDLLKEVVGKSQFLPWVKHNNEGELVYQYITVIIDTAGLHQSEIDLFESVFGAFDFHSDPDFRQLSYVGFKVRTSLAFNESGISAAQRVVKDKSLHALSKALDKHDRKALRGRSIAFKWLDRITLSYQ